MLVLSRKFGETFQIGDDVTITLVRIDRDSVRIGVHAPESVRVRRSELIVTDPAPKASLSASPQS